MFAYEYVPYYILFIVLLLLLLRFYMNAKYGFWMSQPVFHVYDIGYFFSSPRIISPQLPVKNKYTNFAEIQTLPFSQLTSLQQQRFTHFVQTEYLQNGDNTFSPTLSAIVPYFRGHLHPSFFSFYTNRITLKGGRDATPIADEKLLGIMTSRPVYLFLSPGSGPITMEAYYVDYLCVEKYHRKKGIAPQLIQTHHYHQRHQNKAIAVSLFKREQELTGIVPLCVYSTYGFSLEKWKTPAPLSAKYSLLEINGQNVSLFWHFFQEIRSSKFDVVVHTEAVNIAELLKTGNVYIYLLMEKKSDIILGAYVFRKTCVYIERKKEVLSCVASIRSTAVDTDTIFEHGFYHCLSQLVIKYNYQYLAIEEISDNFLLVKDIRKKYGLYQIVSPTAYFLYNYAYPTGLAYKTFILV
jgi:hypothetical protein